MMRSSLLSKAAFVLGVSAVAAAVVPTSSSSASLTTTTPVPNAADLEITSVAGSIEADRASVVLTLPCHKCASDRLTLSLDINSSDRECQDRGVLLNGVPLTLSGPHNRAELPPLPYSNVDQVVYQVTGDLTCLWSKASLISLNVYDEDQHGSDAVATFSISFSQKGQPTILKLVRQSAHGVDLATYLEPSVTVVPAAEVDAQEVKSSTPAGLDFELLNLDLLEAHKEEVENEIKATKDRIVSIWKAQFAECSSIKCYFMTAIEKAPTFAHLIANHWSHHAHIDLDFFRNSTHANCSDVVQRLIGGHNKQETFISAENPDDTVKVEVFENANANDEGPKAVPSATRDVQPQFTSTQVVDAQTAEATSTDMPSKEKHRWHPHFPNGRPPWAQDGAKPPFGRPPWAQDGAKPPFSRPPWAHPGGRPPWAAAPSENHTPAAASPSTYQHHSSPHVSSFSMNHFRIALGITFISLTIFSFILVAMCLCIRRKCIVFRDPRRRAERAARREERRTKALYRKAACKYRWSTFLQRFCRAVSTSDYEEKRELIRNREGSTSDVISPQINNLRAAHIMVGELMRAEEGESSLVRSPVELDAAERQSVRSETLPAYSAPPPSYRHGLSSEVDLSVVDGFTGYTPSGTEDTPDDTTTESSIVDCSPRLSFESSRTNNVGPSS